MSEAITMLSLMMMTSIVSKESLARETHRDRQTDRGLVHVNVLKILRGFDNKNSKKNRKWMMVQSSI